MAGTMPQSATTTTASMKLLAEAADCGLRITGLDGWTQTRLAGALQIRRETLNAIINQSPGAEPTPHRPRMVDACRKLITFAAALAAKEDAVLKLPVDLQNLQTDDGQAYEHHRLRLHQLVETAALDERYAEALCRIGEFASAALHAAPAYRLRMVCNLATAVQRLLDKPASRQIPLPVLQANLGRVYRAERCARGIQREHRDDARTLEQADYVRGQVGYALVFSGMLLPDPRLITRGGRRLFRAAERQPDASYGHWSNLLRAVDDLLAFDPNTAHQWASRAAELAARQGGEAYQRSRDTLIAKGEIQRLSAYWSGKPIAVVAAPAMSTRRRASKLAAWGAAMLLTMAGAHAARAGDGRDFRSAQMQPGISVPQAPIVQTPPALPRMTVNPGAMPSPSARAQFVPSAPSAGGQRFGVQRGVDRGAGLSSQILSTKDIPPDADVPPPLMVPPGLAEQLAAQQRASSGAAGPSPAAPPRGGGVAATPTTTARAGQGALLDGHAVQDGWGDGIRSLAASAAPQSTTRNPPPATRTREYVSVAAMAQLAGPPPAPLTSDQRAHQALSMARAYLAAGRSDVAREKLEALVSAYPQTVAAKEAESLLRDSTSN